MTKINFDAIKNHLGLNLETFITDELISSFISGVEFESSDLNIPSDNNQFSFSFIEKVDNINNIEVRKLSTNKLIISFSVDIEAELNFFVHKADFYTFYSEEEIQHEHVFIEDDDWSKHYMACSTERELSIKIKLIFNLDLKKVTSSEITEVTPKPPTIFTKDFENSFRYIQQIETMSLQPTKEFEDYFRHVQQIRDELLELAKKGVFTFNITDRENDEAEESKKKKS